MNFNTTLIGDLPFLWKHAENLLHFNQARYEVKEIKDDKIHVSPLEQKKAGFLETACKVAALTFLAIPALIIKAAYRFSYSFEIIEVKEKKDPNEQTPPEKSAYDINDVMLNILKAKEDGLKIALFVGRDNSQSIPKEDGWKWFTLDQNIDNSCGTENHFQLDFNHIGSIQNIQNLFNRVVLDDSVLKFMKTPWPTLSKLLVAGDEEAELIAEVDTGCYGISIQGNEDTCNWTTGSFCITVKTHDEIKDKEKEEFEKWRQSVGPEEVAKRYEEYKTRTGVNDEESEEFSYSFKREILDKEGLAPLYKTPIYQKLLDDTKKHLENVFTAVEIVSQHPYQQYPDVIKKYIRAKGTEKKEIFEKNIFKLNEEIAKAIN